MSHGFQWNFISPKESWLNTQGKKKDDLLKGDRPLYSIGLLFNLKNKKYLDSRYKTLRLQIFLDTQSYHVKVAWHQFAFLRQGLTLSLTAIHLHQPSKYQDWVCATIQSWHDLLYVSLGYFKDIHRILVYFGISNKYRRKHFKTLTETLKAKIQFYILRRRKHSGIRYILIPTAVHHWSHLTSTWGKRKKSTSK